MPKKKKPTHEEDDGLTDSASTSTVSNIQSSKRRRRHSSTEQRTILKKNRYSKDEPSNNCATPVGGELKSLRVSITKFTPNGEVRRRSRRTKPPQQPSFEVSIDAELPMLDTQHTDSSFQQCSRAGTSNQQTSQKSARRRRRDRLDDSLSQYFTPKPNSERKCRRLHKEANINHENGDVLNDEKEEESMEVEESRAPLSRQSRTAQKSNHHQQKADEGSKKKSASAAAASTSSNNVKQHNNNLRKLERVLSHKLLKRARSAFKGAQGTRQQMPVTSSLKIKKVPKAPAALKNSNSTNRPAKQQPLTQTAPVAQQINIPPHPLALISEEGRALFDQARRATTLKDLEAASGRRKQQQNPNAPFPPKIRIHRWEMDTWHSAPYPPEFACLPILHICDACLMYLSPVSVYYHERKCRQRFPPGNEIYRGTNFSIFEVDGNRARAYCRNLCLLAKLFIDHKTLYVEVEPFLFYVLTLNDETGCHFVGYFSKQKNNNSQENSSGSSSSNLACIAVLPCYQGHGFGRLLIDFSYLLSRKERQVGGPERPLSDMGRIAYQSYWLSALLEHFHGRLLLLKPAGGGQAAAIGQQLTLREISSSTGITVQDIGETLTQNSMLLIDGEKTQLLLDEDKIRGHWEKATQNKRRIWLEESKLQWTPKSYSPSKEFRLKSWPTTTSTPPANSSNSSPNRGSPSRSTLNGLMGAEMQKMMEIGGDGASGSVQQQKKGKSNGITARRKIQMMMKTTTEPETMSPHKIGRRRKKLADKNVQESESSSSEEAEEEDGQKIIVPIPIKRICKLLATRNR